MKLFGCLFVFNGEKKKKKKKKKVFVDLVVPNSSHFRFLGVGLCLLVAVVVWFLAFFGCPSCDLDAISIGGMEFCYLEFCSDFGVLV